MIWIDLFDFTADSLVLALASHQFDESDYIRNRNAFLSEIEGVA